MAKEYKTLMTEIRLPYELSYGPVWTRFFEGMAEKKLYGTKCEKCGRILVPARSFCPRCFVDTTEWVEVAQEGTLTAWSYVNYRYFGMPTEPPFIGALLRLDGTDVDFVRSARSPGNAAFSSTPTPSRVSERFPSRLRISGSISSPSPATRSTGRRGRAPSTSGRGRNSRQSRSAAIRRGISEMGRKTSRVSWVSERPARSPFVILPLR